MKRNVITRDMVYPNCPIRNILARIADKWSMLALYTLAGAGRKRFNELRQAMPDISPRMLTTTLRTLEQDGLVERKIYAEVPPRVEYELTSRGKSLLPHIDGLINWSLNNFAAIMQDRKASMEQRE